MAWENRGNRQYYYQKRRVGGRVVSEYVGFGYMGDLAAQLDASERRKQRVQRERLRREQVAQDDLDEQLDEVGRQIIDLVTAVLLVSGYHTHKRQWRRRRDDND
jgi:hypothetical protein